MSLPNQKIYEGLFALLAVRHKRAGLLPLLVELSFDGLRVINLVHLSGFVFHSRFLSIPSYDFYSIM